MPTVPTRSSRLLTLAARFADQKVGWFEEPVSSDDLRGLREIRKRAPAGMDIAAGEYAYTIYYVRAMLEAEAVDVQQADVTRCGGVTAFLQIGALCEAFQIDLSGHCAPALHLHVACAVPRLRHLEWFHDHVRIEHMLFDGAPIPEGGVIRPDFSRPGNGLAFKHQDADALRRVGDRDDRTAARHFDPQLRHCSRLASWPDCARIGSHLAAAAGPLRLRLQVERSCRRSLRDTTTTGPRAR